MKNQLENSMNKEKYSIVRIPTNMISVEMACNTDLILEEEGLDLKVIKCRCPQNAVMSELFPNTSVHSILKLFDDPASNAKPASDRWLSRYYRKLIGEKIL